MREAKLLSSWAMKLPHSTAITNKAHIEEGTKDGVSTAISDSEYREKYWRRKAYDT